MVLFFIVLIVVAISIVFVIRTKDPDNTKSNLNIEVPLERQFVSSIVNMEIRNIEAVRFIENGGKSYTINLASIKKIARYLEEKYGKRVYSPGELNSEKAFLLKNFGSRLGPEKFKLLVDTLSQWVENGGSFEYIRKSI